MNSDLELFFLISSLFLVFIAAISVTIVLSNDRKRRLRQQFIELLAAHLHRQCPDNLEQHFANELVRAIENRDFNQLSRVTLVPYLEDYLIDPDFKSKLYHSLVGQMSDKALRLNADELKRTMDQIDLWNNLNTNFHRNILDVLDGASEAGQKKAREFLASRSEFLERKTEEFVRDTKEAVKTAASAA
jgi:hypothetical protein